MPWFLTAVAAFVLLFQLGAQPLYLWDESLYCGATADMLAHHIWLYPVDATGAFFGWYGKPPLINWLQMLSTWCLGWHVASLRLPTALGMVALVVGIAWQARLWAEPAVAWLSVALLLLSAPLLQQGRHILLENIVAPLNVFAVLLYCQARRASPLLPALGWRLAALLLTALCLAAAVLTKQVFGLLLPLALAAAELSMLLPAQVSWQSWTPASQQRPAWAALCGVLAVGGVASGWWFWCSWRAVGAPWLQAMLHYHILARWQTPLEGHVRTLNAYAQSLAHFLPIVPWPVGLYGFVQLRQALQQAAHGDAARFAWRVWLLFALLEYAVAGHLVRTFLPWYQVVVLPPLVIGSAYALLQGWRQRAQWGSWGWLVPSLLVAHVAHNLRWDAVLACSLTVLLWHFRQRLTPAWGWLRRPQQQLQAATWGVALLGLLVVQPWRSSRDGRLQLTQRLGVAATPHIVGGTWRRVWRCYLPQATQQAFSGSCAQLQQQLQQQPVTSLILDEAASQCAALLQGLGFAAHFQASTPQGELVWLTQR